MSSAMDSLIHYQAPDMAAMIAGLAAARPRSHGLHLRAAHAAAHGDARGGQAFPRGNRAPAIEPIGERSLRERLLAHPGMMGWSSGRSERIDSAFYISQAMELVRT